LAELVHDGTSDYTHETLDHAIHLLQQNIPGRFNSTEKDKEESFYAHRPKTWRFGQTYRAPQETMLAYCYKVNTKNVLTL
jgi:hypothetical protein